MVLSRFVLGAEYNGKHLFGVGLCLIGLGLTVVSDLQGEETEAPYPQAWKGDLLCVMGATLYAGSNVMQEDFVKNHDRVRESSQLLRNIYPAPCIFGAHPSLSQSHLALWS